MSRRTPTGLSHTTDAVDQSKPRRPARDHRGVPSAWEAASIAGLSSALTCLNGRFVTSAGSTAFTVIPRCSPLDLVHLWCGYLRTGASARALKVLLGCPDQSADVVTGPYPGNVEFCSAVRLGQRRNVCEQVLRGLAQSHVIGEHLCPEQCFLSVGAQVVGADPYRVGVLRWWLFVLAKP